MIFEVTLCVTTTAILVASCISRLKWNLDLKCLQSELLVNKKGQEDKKKLSISVVKPSQTWEELPDVVKKYLNRVILRPTTKNNDYNKQVYFDPGKTDRFNFRMIERISFHQKGTFLMNDKWYPFTAKQTVVAYPSVGFLWDAKIRMGTKWFNKWIPLAIVVDAFVNGRGYLRANIGGIIPVVSDGTFAKNQNELKKGELLRWLAEALIIPTALHPRAGTVIWKTVSGKNANQCATVQMKDMRIGNEPVELTMIFHTEDKIEIRGYRPFADGNTKGFEDREWVGWCSRFEQVDTYLIPTYFEVGWVNSKTHEVDLYFKGTNSMFTNTFYSPMSEIQKEN